MENYETFIVRQIVGTSERVRQPAPWYQCQGIHFLSIEKSEIVSSVYNSEPRVEMEPLSQFKCLLPDARPGQSFLSMEKFREIQRYKI